MEIKLYESFRTAYDFFNQRLWAGQLPPVIPTLNRKSPNNFGYFAPKRFSKKRGAGEMDELCINPDQLLGRDDVDVLSTLVHEMCHVWQEHFGEPTRNGYHNREWGREMKRVGLFPSNTGAPGGRETGQQMTHYIIEGGQFDVLVKELIASGFVIEWGSMRELRVKEQKNSKVKYTCPDCGQNAWAKSSAALVCGLCMKEMEPEDEEAD